MDKRDGTININLSIVGTIEALHEAVRLLLRARKIIGKVGHNDSPEELWSVYNGIEKFLDKHRLS